MSQSLPKHPKDVQKMCRLLLMHVARFETPLVFLAAKRKQAENIPNKIPAQVCLDTYSTYFCIISASNFQFKRLFRISQAQNVAVDFWVGTKIIWNQSILRRNAKNFKNRRQGDGSTPRLGFLKGPLEVLPGSNVPWLSMGYFLVYVSICFRFDWAHLKNRIKTC